MFLFCLECLGEIEAVAASCTTWRFMPFNQPSKQTVFRVQMEMIDYTFLECPTMGHWPWHWFYLANNCPGKGWSGREKPGFGETRVDFIYHALDVWPWTWIFIIYVRLSFIICKRGFGRWEWGSKCAFLHTDRKHMYKRRSITALRPWLGVGCGISPEGELDACFAVTQQQQQDPDTLTLRFTNWHWLVFQINYFGEWSIAS